MPYYLPCFVNHIKCYLQLVYARGILYARKADSLSDGGSESKLLAYKV